VHRLVQAVIQARLGEEAERRWATAAVELVERSFPDESWEVATWPTCERLLPHALAATGHAERLRVAGEQASWLLGRASTYLRERGQYRQARPIAERALTITKEALGPADPETAWRHEELGSVLQALGDLAGAKAQLERALAIGEAALGPDHPTMAAARNNLGGVLWDLGELEGARVQLERALTVGEAALGPNHPTVAAIRVSLAGVLWDSPGAGVRRGSRTELLGIFVNTGESKRFIPRLVSRLSQFGLLSSLSRGAVCSLEECRPAPLSTPARKFVGGGGAHLASGCLVQPAQPRPRDSAAGRRRRALLPQLVI
jgi:tetratricopeptide (TPR) repeat protein